MIDFKDVMPGMILIADDNQMYTVMHVHKKSKRYDDYNGFMITNKPHGGFTLLGRNRYITHVYHEELKFDEITENQKNHFYSWLFEWLFKKGLRDVDIK